MVRGLDRFREHFAPFTSQYMLIGGTACMVAMEGAGLNFRATKDLDIVLVVEVLDSRFIKAFWQFIKNGGYENKQRSTGKKLFYRFYTPKNPDFPEMLELFSRKPDIVEFSGEAHHLTPVPADEEISSLSAILLDDDCYRFIREGKSEIDDLCVVSPEYLIPLKVRAWKNLSSKLEEGVSIDERDIRKHKNDVLRLYQLLATSKKISLPSSMKGEMQAFLQNLQYGLLDLKKLGLKSIRLDELIDNLKQIYCL